MILMLLNNKIFNNAFHSYMVSNFENTISIKFDELKTRVKIFDDLKKKTTIWQYDNKIIDFSQVTGIYNEITYQEENNFQDYQEEDRRYVSAEWGAYLIYLTQQHIKKTFNPWNHYILSGELFSLPYIYSVFLSKGIKTPEIILSMDKSELYSISQQDSYIPITNISESFNFQVKKKLPENCVGLIKYFPGATLIVHVIDDACFSCIISEDKKINYFITEELSSLCIKTTHDFGLKISELIFKKNNNDVILYRFSPMPRFSNNCIENHANIFHYLSLKLFGISG